MSHVQDLNQKRVNSPDNYRVSADRYPDAFRPDHRRDQKEVRAINRGLDYIADGSRVLDFPCGSGRLLPLLAERHFQVTGADISPFILQRAEQNARQHLPRHISSEAQFQVENILHTSFSDDAFDGVICNRLFHHFNDSDVRVQALKELHRICHGVVVVSFFNRFSLSALLRSIKNTLKGKKPNDRIPIAMSQFESEIREAGFLILDRIATRWGRSPLWYMVLERDD